MLIMQTLDLIAIPNTFRTGFSQSVFARFLEFSHFMPVSLALMVFAECFEGGALLGG